ncbi:pancreatic secretory trypsin inhibitor-like isoform X2 [Centrocercus urophasianus]|uniref:pancreatic secretory trypsin inhibitor-like isoform X2 n=1 Tax=Centrocercus urophasianus TaxID=9002 RepID=UPI001C64A65F|nr:pancreatic secretory trypsin inhibitor-like isoform X2 [Centrocercus urophasianus]
MSSWAGSACWCLKTSFHLLHHSQIPGMAACGNYDIGKGCTKNFDPICGTDDVLYGNECLLCVQNMQRHTNVRIKNRGKCQEPSPRSRTA